MATQSKLKFWLYHMAIATDQFFNAFLGGAADETLSSRTYRGAKLAKPPKKRWRVLFRLIEGLFFWEKDHCKKAYHSELSRKQYSDEFRARVDIGQQVKLCNGKRAKVVYESNFGKLLVVELNGEELPPVHWHNADGSFWADGESGLDIIDDMNSK